MGPKGARVRWDQPGAIYIIYRERYIERERRWAGGQNGTKAREYVLVASASSKLAAASSYLIFQQAASPANDRIECTM